jgi:hypothetical protein
MHHGNGLIHVSESRQHDDGRVPRAEAQLAKELNAIGSGHHQVTENYVYVVRLKFLQRLPAVSRGEDMVAYGSDELSEI